jgi:competence protein ComEA
MTRAALIWFVAAAITAGASLSASRQSAAPSQGRTFTAAELATYRAALPDAPARETVIRACGQCHEPQRAASLRLTRQGWEDVVQKMKGLGVSAFATDAELAQITDYLSENFKGEAPKPLNLNSANAIDLEAVAGLLRKEAAAWIAYRSKTPCKSLDDLKQVPGVPFEKIDKRRDRLVCF